MKMDFVDDNYTNSFAYETYTQTTVPFSELIDTFLSLAQVCKTRRQFDNAEVLLTSALELQEMLISDRQTELLPILEELGEVYTNQKQFTPATKTYLRMFGIAARQYGNEHPMVAGILEKYANALQGAQREIESAILQTRAKAIRLNQQDIPSVPNLQEPSEEYAQAVAW